MYQPLDTHAVLGFGPFRDLLTIKKILNITSRILLVTSLTLTIFDIYKVYSFTGQTSS